MISTASPAVKGVLLLIFSFKIHVQEINSKDDDKLAIGSSLHFLMVQ